MAINFKTAFCIFIFFFCFYSNKTIAQSDSSQTTQDTINQNQFFIYPFVFYLPETRWGFGAVGLYTFRFKDERHDSNPSQIQFTANYTQNKQVNFIIPFELYRYHNRWKVKGEIGYFIYLYNFYGIGNTTLKEDRETYKADYPRFRIDCLRRLGDFFVGARYRFDNAKIFDFKQGGILDSNPIEGKQGGRVGGFGIVAQYDSRDFIFNPTKGCFIEGEIFIGNKFSGSEYNFQRYAIDAATFIPLGSEQTLGIHLNTATMLGSPFFNDLLYFGSPKIMRGYQDRRFTDRNLYVLQTEYRYPIYRRLQGVAFTAIGNVGDTYPNLFTANPKFTYGAGLRVILNKRDRVRLRIDYGRTVSEGGAFYATINEAF